MSFKVKTIIGNLFSHDSIRIDYSPQEENPYLSETDNVDFPVGAFAQKKAGPSACLIRIGEYLAKNPTLRIHLENDLMLGTICPQHHRSLWISLALSYLLFLV